MARKGYISYDLYVLLRVYVVTKRAARRFAGYSQNENDRPNYTKALTLSFIFWKQILVRTKNAKVVMARKGYISYDLYVLLRVYVVTKRAARRFAGYSQNENDRPSMTKALTLSFIFWKKILVRTKNATASEVGKVYNSCVLRVLPCVRVITKRAAVLTVCDPSGLAQI
jgi:hypothetical protein